MRPHRLLSALLLVCLGALGCGQDLSDSEQASLALTTLAQHQAANIAFPELKQVIVADAKRVVMKDCLKRALDALVGVPLTPCLPDTGPPTNGEPLAQPQVEDVRQAIEELRQTLDRLEQILEELLKSTEEGEQ